jgi:dihydroorotase
MKQIISFRKPWDLHVHVRQEKMLKKVLPFTTNVYAGALFMPNLTPPIINGDMAVDYLQQMHDSSPIIMRHGMPEIFTPIMTIKITPETKKVVIVNAIEKGVKAGKLYAGMTTNESRGLEHGSIQMMFDVFKSMEEAGMVLCVHGETSGFIMDREKEFIKTIEWLCENFPNLKVVFEHITTAGAVEVVRKHPNLYATITAHHLAITLDDVLAYKTEKGEFLHPHNYCKPIAKTPTDREALVLAATSGSEKYFFGSDSAPHEKGAKESFCGCAGVFMPGEVAMPLLLSIFKSNGRLENLEKFVSENGPKMYGFEPSNKEIELVQGEWTVPMDYSGIVPFMAGKKLDWKIA